MIGLTLINCATTVLVTAVLFDAVGASVPLAFVTAAILPAMFAGLLPFTLAGMGTRDSVLIVLFAAYASAAQSLSVGLLDAFFFRWLLSLLGLPFLQQLEKAMPTHDHAWRSAGLPHPDARIDMTIAPREASTNSAWTGCDGELAVSILVPAYNEALAIGGALAAVQQAQLTLDCSSELLVIDDGSDDGTGQIATHAGARVVTHTANRGKGAALKTGIRAARGKTIVVIDADGQHDPTDLPALLKLRPAYDMVMGDRGRAGGASPRWRAPGKALLGLVANVLPDAPSQI